MSHNYMLVTTDRRTDTGYDGDILCKVPKFIFRKLKCENRLIWSNDSFTYNRILDRLSFFKTAILFVIADIHVRPLKKRQGCSVCLSLSLSYSLSLRLNDLFSTYIVIIITKI